MRLVSLNSDNFSPKCLADEVPLLAPCNRIFAKFYLHNTVVGKTGIACLGGVGRFSPSTWYRCLAFSFPFSKVVGCFLCSLYFIRHKRVLEKTVKCE